MLDDPSFSSICSFIYCLSFSVSQDSIVKSLNSFTIWDWWSSEEAGDSLGSGAVVGSVVVVWSILVCSVMGGFLGSS